VKEVKVRITGTINDVVEVEVDDDTTDEDAVKQALEAWRYVEYEDLTGEVE
jgi:hypothetical protein